MENEKSEQPQEKKKDNDDGRKHVEPLFFNVPGTLTLSQTNMLLIPGFDLFVFVLDGS